MRKSILVIAILLGLPTWSCFSAETLHIGIAETEDSYTRTLGLADFLSSEGLSFTDLSNGFEEQVVPDLSRLDLLIIGSFLTNDPEKKATYLAAGEALRAFVSEGGTVAVLCQADQDLGRESWMEPPRLVVRADPDSATAYLLQATHALLTAPETLAPKDLAGWRVPTSWGRPNTGWETFTEFKEGAAVLGAARDTLDQTILIEMGWGRGRALFYAMAPDKAVRAGNPVSQDASVKLLRNLVHYASKVREGDAPPVALRPAEGYPHPITGVVFSDANGNGIRDAGEPARRDVKVSDGLDVVLTTPDGRYVLPNPGRDADFVFVCQPNDTAKSSTGFYHLLSRSLPATAQFDFPLLPAKPGSAATRVLFVQITDIHTINSADKDLQREALQEIYDLDPRPDFLVSTGDMVGHGVPEQLENYRVGLGKPTLPCFNVLGNHDIYNGSLRRYRSFLGPEHYSFDQGGVHFVARNSVNPTSREKDWLQRDLALLAPGTPVVFFQHYPPGVDDLAQMDAWGVHSVFTGHLHSEKQVQSGATISVNSPTFLMGGIDCSPAGFKLVSIGADGNLTTEWRYGGQDQRVTIVSPAHESSVSSRSFPILVNAYDSSLAVRRVDWTLRRAGSEAASGTLVQDSPVSWSGEFTTASAVSFTGPAELAVQVEDRAGRIWTATSAIRLESEEPPSPAPKAPWPAFMGSASHAGHANARLSLPLRLAWSVDTGGDLDFSSPILADGRLYVALKRRGTARKNGVVALRPADGQVLWNKETPFAINHTPAYESGVLCVAEVGGRVYGFDATTGAERWRHDLIDNLGRYSFCAPAARDGKFYVGTMRRLACLDAQTGKVDWESGLGADWVSSYSSPAAGGGFVALGGVWTSPDSLVVLEAATGQKVWGHSADNGLHGSPTIAGDRVLFAGYTSTLYCRALKDGAALWERPLGMSSASRWSATTPAIRGDIVVAGSGDGAMKGMRLSDGEELWSHTSGPTVFKVSPYRRDDRGLLSSPTIASDKVFFGSTDGRLYCLDLETGQPLWSFDFGVPVLSTPLVSGNALFVSSYDGRLYAFASP